MEEGRIRVGINGYGVIGKRVADAVTRQPDMSVTGVCDVATDWRVHAAIRKGYRWFAASEAHVATMQREGLTVSGTLDDLLTHANVVVDCTPKRVAATNVDTYRRRQVRFVLQGGEGHDITGHSFVAESNYGTAVAREATRVVSCNTTSIVRTLSALRRSGLLQYARGTLLRRATDPVESHQGGIMNTLVPERAVPSHQGMDARTVDADLDVVTMAVVVPETLAHLHYWWVRLKRPATTGEILDAFRTSSRITLIRAGDGVAAPNVVKELMADLGRAHGDLYEVALWEDMLRVQGDELFYAYMVDNQAIVIPETIDAIRALMGAVREGAESIATTNASLGITGAGALPVDASGPDRVETGRSS